MSLIYCPECSKSISSDAKSCPHCGLPLEEKKIKVTHTVTRYSSSGWGPFICFLIAVAGLVLLLEGNLFGLFLVIIGIVLLVARVVLWRQRPNHNE